MGSKSDHGSRQQRIYSVTKKLRKGYENGKLTESQILRLEAIGFPFDKKPFISLAEAEPTIADEWDYERNAPLTPQDVSKGSGRKVWWKCSKCGWRWRKSVGLRTTPKKRSGCPVCSNAELVAGVNDLETKRPDIAVRWHPTKNGDLTPHDVTAGSQKKVWWKCPDCGSEYEKRVCDLTGGYVPICANCKNIHRFEGRSIVDNQKLMKYFDPQLNEGIDPRAVSAQSEKTLTWRCGKGHVFKQNPAQIIRQQNPCPKCRKISAAEYPWIFEYWDYTKNGSLRPEDFSPGSNRKVWWKCPTCGGEWEAKVANRARGHRCPYCTGRKVLVGFNDLETTYPELAKQWHPTKNGDLTPHDVTAGSQKKVWWKCPDCGKEWEAIINSRTKRINPTGCPICGGAKSVAKNVKAVIRVEDGVYYPSMKRAAEALGTKNSTNIGKAIRRGIGAYGYHWRYATDEEIAALRGGKL